VTTLRVSGAVLWLTALWVALWGSVTFANVAGGLVASVGVLTFARLPRIRNVDPDQQSRINPIASLWLLVFVVYKLAEANLILAWEILTPRNKIRTGVIAVPLRTQSETAMMVVANVITLTPGTVTLDAAGSPPVLYVHVLHLNEIERVRDDLLHIEELTVRAFGSRAMRRDLAEGRSR
jgi:multicomponent Na+:H+ antiporter subunit E